MNRIFIKRGTALLFLFSLVFTNITAGIPLIFRPSTESPIVTTTKDGKSLWNNEPLLADTPKEVHIIVSFPRLVTTKDLSSFASLGGQLSHGPWSAALYGFAGTILDSAIPSLQSTLPDAIIEFDQSVTTSLNYVTRVARARNYTWDTLGLNGTSNGTIAILDTGINASHGAFEYDYDPLNWSTTIIAWNDPMSDSSNPYDDNGHGTFIASVIASRGFTTESPTGGIVANVTGDFTHAGLFSQNGQYPLEGRYEFTLMSVNVTESNTNVSAQSRYFALSDSVAEFQFVLRNSSHQLVQTVTVDQTGQYYSLDYNVGTQLGVYDLCVRYNASLLSTFAFSVDSQVTWHCALSTDGYLNSTGIAPGSKIASVKVLNSTGSGNFADIIEGLNWVKENMTASQIVAVCLSIESTELTSTSSQALNDTINDLINAGILVVVAGGNKGVATNALNRIALNPKVLVVGATNEQDQVTYYSSQGETVGGGIIKPDIVAPGGSQVPGHLPVYGASNWSGQLTNMEGTSIATAVVAGTVNILLQALGSFDNWNYTNGQSALDVKARMLMTATETNQDREDNPLTTADESTSSPTLSRGDKDIHEGYGRLNIDAAAESILLNMTVGQEERANLTSSIVDAQGKHAWARHIVLDKYQPYLLNLTIPATGDFDLYLYYNDSDAFGEPRLVSKSISVFTGISEQIYFTPQDETREYILVVKAVSGSGQFSINISYLQNSFYPALNVIWIESDDPATNNTWSTYTVYVNYTDADNNPPVAVTLNITNVSIGIPYNQNFSMVALNNTDQNYTDGAIFYRSFTVVNPGDYQVFASTFDGIYYNDSIKIIQMVDSIKASPYPYINDFYDNYPGRGTQWDADIAISNWTTTPAVGDRWYFHYNPYYISTQEFTSLSYKPYWHFSRAFYGTTVWDYSENITMDLLTPYIFITDANNPIAHVSVRVSMNFGDYFYISIQENDSTWVTLDTYTNTEFDWTELQFNLSSYVDSYIRLRFRCTTNNIEDNLQNKGVIIDRVSFEDYNNTLTPTLSDPNDSDDYNPRAYVEPQAGSRYQKYRFNVVYIDDQMPTYVYLEMDGVNHTMYNAQHEVFRVLNPWKPTGGILYSVNITVTDFTSRQYRFHASDGVHVVSSEWFIDGPIVSRLPETIRFPFSESFTGSGYESWFVAGTPDKMENHEWLESNTSWDIVYDPFNTPHYFWYCGIQTILLAERTYGPNWDAWLISKPINVNSPQDVHLYFTHQLNFDQFWGDDHAFVDISTDYGRTFTTLVTFGGFNNTGGNYESFDIDISKYNRNNITLRFRFVSDDVPDVPTTGINIGWRISHIEVNASVEINAPSVLFTSPDVSNELAGIKQINFAITDDTGVDATRTEVYINNVRVTPSVAVDQNHVVHISYDWDTRSTPNGIVRIRIVTFDTYGNRQDLTYLGYVNNPFDWIALFTWISIIGAIALFLAVTYKTNFFRTYIERSRAAKKLKERTRATTIAQMLGIPVIGDDLVNEEYEAHEEFTLHCTNCKKDFHSDKFEWMCPACDRDTLFIKTSCVYCGTPALLDDPRKYYCQKCGSRLFRQPAKIIAQLREAVGADRASELAKKRIYPVITDEVVNEEAESNTPLSLKCKKCGTTYESDRFLWTCPKCQSDTLFMRSKCLHCDKELLLDSPRKNHCEKCGSRLLRQPEKWAKQHLNVEYK